MKYTLITLAALSGAAFGQTVTNGSLEGGTQAQENWVPPGWTRFITPVGPSTPDYSFGTDRQFYTALATDRTPSPDGGGYIGLIGADTFSEGITGEMIDLQAGKLYELSYYFTAENKPGYIGGSSPLVQFTSGSTIIANHPAVTGYDSPDRPWSEHSFTFTATSATMPLTIRSLAPEDTWGFIDGLRLKTVPEPSSTALLGLGGLALILRRRK